jgi:hypothetical protein
MKRVVFALFLFCCTQGYAKTPIPDALLNAKKAIVRNDRALEKDFLKLVDALKKWGRFELVQDRASADIIILLSANLKTRNVEMPDIGGGMGSVQSQEVLVNHISILNATDYSQLWSDDTSVESNEPKDLVARLKSKLK